MNFFYNRGFTTTRCNLRHFPSSWFSVQLIFHNSSIRASDGNASTKHMEKRQKFSKKGNGPIDMKILNRCCTPCFTHFVICHVSMIIQIYVSMFQWSLILFVFIEHTVASLHLRSMTYARISKGNFKSSESHRISSKKSMKQLRKRRKGTESGVKLMRNCTSPTKWFYIITEFFLWVHAKHKSSYRDELDTYMSKNWQKSSARNLDWALNLFRGT